MPFLNLVKKRYSVRKFQSKPVETEKLNAILEAGRMAPSACNLQPWQFLVISKPDQCNNFAKTVYAREWLQSAPVIIVICGDHSESWKRRDAKDHCDIDCAIAADHMTLAAAELGLGTCWICNFDVQKCRTLLKLPDPLEPVVILPLGYPDDSVSDRHTSRKPAESVYRFL